MHAYLILAHTKLDHLLRLVHRLSSEQTAFFVHLDKQTNDAAYAQEISALGKLPRVHFVRRYRSPWGAFGLVKATITGISTALRTYAHLTHVTLLSGQDYPIKPPDQIDSFFDGHRDTSFIEHFPLPRGDWPGDGGLSRIEDWHFYFAGKHLRVRNSRYGIKRKVPYGLRPFQGGSYFSLSRECAKYACAFTEQNPGFVRFFKRTNNSDESFWQTIILNSPYREKVVNDDLRYEIWVGNRKHPQILRTKHFADIVASSRLFAKKFDSSVDPNILDFIDRDILRVGPSLQST